MKRLEENDLYVKLEKYVWKTKKIGFLGVVIGPNGIEIEKKKVVSQTSFDHISTNSSTILTVLKPA